ncbi:NAD(P)H-binding protein [Streptosporangium soli]|nr:NAD(P)H-binding protein [Streptosporangium sp. KLBMP 9127]
MILITGAAGGLGRLVVDRLTTRGDAFVAGSRTPGEHVRKIDFDDPAGLAEGFAGAETVLLISAGYGEDDVVIARHGAAIDAAEKAGVRHIVYTSLMGAGDHLTFALPHRWTERRLIEGTADWTILRNGLYAELLVQDAATAVASGTLTAPIGTYGLAAVAREDLADAAVRVLADPAAHRHQIYELVGDRPIGGDHLAAALSTPDRPVAYRPGTLAEVREVLTAFGAASFQVPMLVSIYSAIAGGFLADTGGDLPHLLGTAPRPALDVILAGASGS